MSIEKKVLDWFFTGKTGVSSKAMAAAVCDKDQGWSGSNHPHDPDDFNRCLLFLDAVPEAREHMDKIAAISPAWRKLVERWSEIEKCFIDEAGFNWCMGRSAPRTYRLMREVIESARSALTTPED